MPKVKALYHFLDRKACRNRRQGDVFEVSEERAKELVEAGFAIFLEAKAKVDPEPVKVEEVEPETEMNKELDIKLSENPDDTLTDPPSKRAKAKKYSTG